jgi:hypothetical protein
MCYCIIKMTEKFNTLQIHIFIYPNMDTSKQYIMCCLGECLGEWAERSDSLSESPCSLTRVGRLQYTGGLTNTAKANATVSNGCTPYKKCSCPYELFEQRTHMVSWFHLMSLVIFHLISAEAGDHMCSLFEKLIWTWAFFVRDWVTLRTRWSCSSSFLSCKSFHCGIVGRRDVRFDWFLFNCFLLSDVKFKIRSQSPD